MFDRSKTCQAKRAKRDCKHLNHGLLNSQQCRKWFALTKPNQLDLVDVLKMVDVREIIQELQEPKNNPNPN